MRLHKRTFERLREIAMSSVERQKKARKAAELICAERDFHWVGLYDVTPTEISAIAWTGANTPAFPRFPKNQGLNGAAVREGRDVIVQDVTKDSRYLTTFGSTRAEAIFIVATTAKQTVGTIDVESEQINAFTAEDEDFLRNCADALRPLWLPAT